MKSLDELIWLPDEQIEKEIRAEVIAKWSNNGTNPICEFMGIFADKEINDRIKMVAEYRTQLEAENKIDHYSNFERKLRFDGWKPNVNNFVFLGGLASDPLEPAFKSSSKNSKKSTQYDK